MKKIFFILTALILFSISAHTQRTPRERTRPETQNKKSEATVNRSPQSRTLNQDPKSRTQLSRENTRIIRRPESQTSRTQQSSRETNINRNRRVITEVNKNQGNGTNRTVTRNTRKPVTNPVNVRDNHPRTTYTPQGRHRVRQMPNHVQQYLPVRYNTVRINYKVPRRINVYWTSRMYRDYRVMYPDYNYWYYPVGYRILTVPAYNAYMYFGEVSNIYGRVHDVWYSWSTDEYFLYFGNTYPYQDFTVILSGNHARRFSRLPELYFTGRYIWVTGLVSTFDGKPEIIVKRKTQVHSY